MRAAGFSNRGHGTRIRPPDWKVRSPAPAFTDEEKEFLNVKVDAGLSGAEVARMFFRKYNRDISPSYVRTYRRRRQEAKDE